MSKRDYYYSSIEDFPLYNWIKCSEDNKDLSFVRKGKEGSKKYDELYWQKIYNDYLDTFGLSKYHKKLLSHQKKRALAQLEHVITENKWQKTLIEMETQKLESILQNNGTGISIEQSLIHLSKWLGYYIKTKEISVKEFFLLSKEFERVNKASNGEKNK